MQPDVRVVPNDSGYRVRLSIGVQHFNINDPYDEPEYAWVIAKHMRIALSMIAAPVAASDNALKIAMQKVMARLADLLDEDQFADIEGIVQGAGVEPPVASQRECETCARKRERLLKAGFLKSPLRAKNEVKP